VSHECVKESEWGIIETKVTTLKDDFTEHRKGAWMRAGAAGVIGGFIGTGAGEFIIRVVSMAFGVHR